MNFFSSIEGKLAVSDDLYPASFISAVGEWQNYGGGEKKVADNLKKEVSKIANTFTNGGTFFRVMSLTKETFEIIQSGKPYKYENLSSWTKSLQVINAFMRDHWYDTISSKKGITSVLLKKDFPQVILDIDALWKTPKFKKSVAYYESKGLHFNEGLEFRDSQQEVVIGPFVLKESDIEKVYK